MKWWKVAPYAGAWIETKNEVNKLFSFNVAPYAGAWIETPLNNQPFAGTCRPLGRGVD